MRCTPVCHVKTTRYYKISTNDYCAAHKKFIVRRSWNKIARQGYKALNMIGNKLLLNLVETLNGITSNKQERPLMFKRSDWKISVLPFLCHAGSP